MTRPIRSGSYPLMNLAEDFGVDYGDVLQKADLYRAYSSQLEIPLGRWANLIAASNRVSEAVLAANRVEEFTGRFNAIGGWA